MLDISIVLPYVCIVCIVTFFLMAQQPPVGQGLPIIEASNYTQTHHSWWDSPGRVISPTQGPVPYNAQHSQETDINVSTGFDPANPSKRTALDPTS
jgi:hypothetical protein